MTGDRPTPESSSAAPLDEMVPLVYSELRRLAAHYPRGERRNHTLQPTALVNEAYLCLVAQKKLQWKNRAHFLAIAARTLRHILVDHARARGAWKRGGDRQRIALDESVAATVGREVDFVALDQALSKLAAFDPMKSRLVELRFFGGLTVEEAAEVLDVSPATVKRTWTLAQAWLYRELELELEGEGGGSPP
jgi:RNA polymerase sigma factor (TIGR02999 family)